MASRASAVPLPGLRIDRVIDPKAHVLQVAATGDGLSIFIPHPRFWLRNAVRAVNRARSKMRQAFAPLPLTAVFLGQVGGIAVLYAIRQRTVTGGLSSQSRWLSAFASTAEAALAVCDKWLPLVHRVPRDLRPAYVATAAASAVTGVLTICHRRTLRLLLSYTRWIDEVRGPKSLSTRIWYILLKYVYIRGTTTPTYALQNCLPQLPVPALRDTVDRYLASMEAVLDPAEMAVVRNDANQFVQGEGVILQRYLVAKSYFAKNYVADWWLQVVYLRGRDSLMVNSNYYGIALYRAPPTNNQAARAATFVNAIMQVKAAIDRELLPRTTLQEVVPLCMAQYQGVFAMTREPGVEMDRLVQYDHDRISRHVVVLHKGRFYKVFVYAHRDGRLLSRFQLATAFQGIIDSNKSLGDEPAAERDVAALTALPRSQWAEVRTNVMQRDPINRAALETIEQALFVVSLDDTECPWSDLTQCGRTGIHGAGNNRWLDKSFNLVITADATVVCNAEHSWADAPTLSHVQELALQVEARAVADGACYAADGTAAPSPSEAALLARGETLAVYGAERLHFNMTPALQSACAEAAVNAQNIIDNLDLQCERFTAFGKGRMKKFKVSPDAFVQVALQLAYFRDQGQLVQTYESGTARLFVEGRTETIRSASVESTSFVRALTRGGADRATLTSLLRAACEKHQRTTALAMTGRGCDRHLFALYVVAVGTHVESGFLSKAMRRGWKLSTSQIPQVVTDFARPNDGDEWIRPAGGFGAVAEDGYGICYTISGENSIFFHVSCNRSCTVTDSARMQKRIAEALIELSELLAPTS